MVIERGEGCVSNGMRRRARRTSRSIRSVLREPFRSSLILCIYLEIPDPCENEDRWNAIGFAGSVLFVVYTERKDDVIRIISVRKATKEEIDGYEDGYFGRS